MKYRTRLLLLFSALALFASALVVALMYFGSRSHLRDQMNSTAMSIAATAATLVDPDLHESIVSTNDQTSAAYQRLEQVLRKARDQNRRDDVDVRFIFTLRPVPGKEGQMQFVIDAEEGKDKSNVGDVYIFKGEDARPIPFGETAVQPGFLQDEWGTWLEAYAPIRDRSGKTIAVLGVDLKASDVVQKLDRLLLSGGVALGISLIAGLGLALLLARWIARPLAVVDTALKAIGEGKLDTHVDLQSNDEFGAVAKSINAMVVGLRQREYLKDSLVSYVSSHVAENVLASGRPSLSGERRKITVLFSDVRNFTTLSERLPPELVVTFLNEYFALMIDIIMEYRGTLDKFIGDGLMAFFGAPQDDEQEAQAIRAALKMRRSIARLQDKWRNEQDLDIRIGIGIHTGPAVVGNIGSMQKMQYTAIGDTVNLAARLESATKELGADIVISEETVNAVRDQFQFQPLKSIHVKGREAEVMVYAVTEPAKTAEK
jgi:adenylate cyclase